MDKDQIAQLLYDAEYKFAKTMPKIPHSYTKIYTWDDPELFYQVAEGIRYHGVYEKFFRKTYVYFYADGYKYWVMDENPRDAILINRAEAPESL